MCPHVRCVQLTIIFQLLHLFSCRPPRQCRSALENPALSSDPSLQHTHVGVTPLSGPSTPHPRCPPVADSPEVLRCASLRGHEWPLLAALWAGTPHPERSGPPQPWTREWRAQGVAPACCFKEVCWKLFQVPNKRRKAKWFFKKNVYSLSHARPKRKNVGTELLCSVFCKMPSICMTVRWSGHFSLIAQIP